MKFIVSAVAASLLICGSAFGQQLAPSPTLDAVKARGHVECGVHLGLPGFSFANDKGEWTGLDVDYCRSLAAAVLGDATKVKFTPTSVQQRWPMLQSGQVDLLSRNTTITFSRNATLGVNFQGINFYEGQTFVVRTKAKVLRRRRIDRGQDGARLVPRAQPQGHHHQLPEERRRHLGLRPGPLRRLYRGHRRARRPAHQVQEPRGAPDPDRDHLQRSAGPGDALG
jgi:hypothetical protein